ncbi:fasciclin domain-containing protein [uncultured Ilumatobacter sp.]|uniref:fasciclin domain-containing protein n=1 Tax=uncultured Ilumatobacter sp. TaxID=879968 RepID=UPI00374F4E69
MTDVPGPPAGNPGDVPSAGGNPTDPTIAQPVMAASAPFTPAPGGLVAEEDQPWYRSPGGIAAGAAVLVVLLGLLLFALFGGSDDDSSVVSTDVEDSVQLEITRMTRTEEGVPATLTATVIGPDARPADYGWILPSSAQAPEPAVGTTDESGKLKFAWAPVAKPAPATTWSSTITITEVLPANATLLAASYECVLNRGGVKSNITIFVKTSTEPVTEPRTAAYSFSGVKFVPGDFATCPILSGDMNVESTTTTTPETTTTTPETTTTVAPPKAATVLEIIENREDLSLFYEAIKVAGMENELKDSGPFTIMAPNDEAMKQLADEPDLEDEAAAKDFVNAHVLEGEELERGDFVDGVKITFRDDVERLVKADGSTITIDDAEVLDDPAAERADNGIVHTLNKTLIPPTP